MTYKTNFPLAMSSFFEMEPMKNYLDKLSDFSRFRGEPEDVVVKFFVKSPDGTFKKMSEDKRFSAIISYNFDLETSHGETQAVLLAKVTP